MKKRFPQLGLYKLVLCSPFANGQRFSATENGSYEILKAKINLVGQHCIRFIKIFSSLTMPNDAIWNSQRMQHFYRNFPGKSPILAMIAVLCCHVVIALFLDFTS